VAKVGRTPDLHDPADRVSPLFMTELLYKAVERILTEGDRFSRNKNFDAFEDATMHRALKIVKHLRSLRADLLRVGDEGVVSVAEVPEPGRCGHTAIELSIVHLAGRRVAYLRPEEFRLLALEPDVAAVIERWRQRQERREDG
jgi:hypothetical protein